MKKPIKFEFVGKRVRTVEVDGETWYVTTDIGVCLGLKPSGALAALCNVDEEDKIKVELKTNYGTRNVSVISAFGVVQVMAHCRKPEARKAREWARREGLPYFYANVLPEHEYFVFHD